MVHLWKIFLITTWNFPSHSKVVSLQWNSGATNYKGRQEMSKDAKAAFVLKLGIRYMTFLSSPGMMDKWSGLMEQHKSAVWAIHPENCYLHFNVMGGSHLWSWFKKITFGVLLLHCNGWLCHKVRPVTILGGDTSMKLGQYSLQVSLRFAFPRGFCDIL